MSLLEEQKAERRTRILAAARKLLASRGYDGLTMRELADDARVSVPTLYNLIGSKDAIITAELVASAQRIAAQLPRAADTALSRALTAFNAGMALVEAEPELYRAAMAMFLTASTPETQAMRQRVEDGYLAMMSANLAAAQASGQLAEWADPYITARHIWSIYISAFIGWGIGELDLETFREAALSGLLHLLAGVARGPFATDVEHELRALRTSPPLLRYKEARHAASRARD
jgi:AcrR family transcriptional regulator